METIEARRRETESEVVFDWRFAELRRVGLPPQACWLLAGDRDVDLRLAERLFTEGCPTDTLLAILL